MRYIELLAPARDIACGIEAIKHGADAVYIGAPRFGARAAAGNAVADIGRLVAYAHMFGVRIYVTVNTLLRDDELADAQTMIDALADICVDALIVQDPRIRLLADGKIPLHASTQMDNRTAADVLARQADGYEQTVLARELSIDDIRAIHQAVPQMTLEAFVHGALCVCYSGRCYASEVLFGRSANRGVCAQVCRLPFELVTDSPSGSSNIAAGHFLSLLDMNRSADIEAMMDAGVSSFKIEGRLKDVAYVKNTTAWYRQHIDAILRRRPDDYCRSSAGISRFTFTPDPSRSFNRGFTDYFLHTPYGSEPGHRPTRLANFDTPKSIGQPVATVRQQQGGRLQVAVITTATLANGDGLCYFDSDGRLHGFRMNRIDEHNWIYPADRLAPVAPGTMLYRNYDRQFEQQLSRPTAERRLPIAWHVSDTPDGFRLRLVIARGTPAEVSAEQTFLHKHETARTPQADNIRRQLSRLGDTIYEATDIDIDFADNWFIPSSKLAEWRRELTEKVAAEPLPTVAAGRPTATTEAPPHVATPQKDTPAHDSDARRVLMTCRYCLRHELGACLRKANGKTLPAHLALRLANGRTLPLRFDCQRCEMQLLSDTNSKTSTQ